MSVLSIGPRSTKNRRRGPNRRTTGENLVWTSVHLPDGLLARLEQYADDHGVTRSTIQRTATEIGMRALERQAQRDPAA